MINNNLTKINFAKDLKDKMGFPMSLSNSIVNDLIIIFTEMIKKNSFTLKNIGTFKLIEKKERIGRNPKTKEKFIISRRKSIRFVVSRNLSKALNEFNG